MNQWETAIDAVVTRTEKTRVPSYPATLPDFVLTPAGRGALYFGLLGLGLAFCIVGIQTAVVYWLLPGFPLLFAGTGGLLFLFDRLREYSPDLEETETAVHTLPPAAAHPLKSGVGKIWVDWGNGFPGQYYWEPKPGAFRNWVRATAVDAATWGYHNEGKPRGWSRQQYLQLIGQLRNQGIIDESGNKHVPPKYTGAGKTFAAEWVGGLEHDTD